jgi:hypothetical protein
MYVQAVAAKLLAALGDGNADNKAAMLAAVVAMARCGVRESR